MDVLGSRLAARGGDRLVHPKKRGALLAALGPEPMLARRGGGGTSFAAVRAYAESRDDPVDAVIVVTGGYADAIAPAEPGRWIWPITPGGHDRPEHRDPPMACHRIEPV